MKAKVGNGFFFSLSCLLLTIFVIHSNSVSAAPVTLTGDYIKIGTTDTGTLGSGGNTSPGILYDNTGTGTFNTSYDYLTPGTPFEGFYIKTTSGGTTYHTGNNNAAGNNGPDGAVTTVSFNDISGTNFDNEVKWTGSFDPGGGKIYDIINTVGYNNSDKQITITTKITAAADLTNLYLLRVNDPDARAAVGDSSATNNVRGTSGIAATNLVYAEALVSKYVIGLKTDAASGVNTGISNTWSKDPAVYYAGTDSGNGDYTIGMAFYDASLLNGESVTFTYYYIFGSDISAAVGGLSVLTSSTNMVNNPALGSAAVIDNHSNLLALFSDAGLSTDSEISDAATQTLPLLTGGSAIAVSNTLAGVNNVIQARMAQHQGMSSGDKMDEDRYFWLKPFGTWAEQEDRNNVSGFQSESAGLLFGFDKTFSDTWRLGLAFAYSHTSVDGNSATAPQYLDIDSYQLIGYGSKSLRKNIEMNFQLDGGMNCNDGERRIAFTNTIAAADYESYFGHAGVGIAHQYKFNEKTSLISSINSDYTYIQDKKYTETGAGLLNLTVDDRSTDELIVGIQGKLNRKLWDNTSVDITLGVGHDFCNERAKLTAAFAGAPGASFVTYGLKPSPWIANAGIGLTHKTDRVEMTARYISEYRDDYLSHSVSLKFRWAF